MNSKTDKDIEFFDSRSDGRTNMVNNYIKHDVKATAKLAEQWGFYRQLMNDYNRHRHMPEIKKVIFNDPATIIIWSDDSKTVVKCENETYDPEKGLAMAISKKVLGDKGNYYETFKKWLPKEDTEVLSMDEVRKRIGEAGNKLSMSFLDTLKRYSDEQRKKKGYDPK